MLDPSGYIPSVVRASAEALADSVGHYLFVSSVSAYASLAQPVDEDSPVAELGDLPADRLTEDYSNYGALKALCEQAVADVFGERQASVRPGLIVGAHDPTGRFTYWPHRVARGGRVVAPAPPDAQVQFIDAKDLGAWMVDLSERRAGRRLQRHASRPQLARDARDLPRGQRQRRDLRLGSGRGAERARGRRVDGAPALDLRSGLGRDARGGRLARGRGRAHLPPARGDGARHARARRARSTASASRPSAKPSC